MIFDILILLGLGTISALGINTAFQSHRHFKKTQLFAETHLKIMEENSKAFKEMNKNIKDIRAEFKSKVSNNQNISEADVVALKTNICEKYGKENCGLCKGSNECVLERMATKPQRVVR